MLNLEGWTQSPFSGTGLPPMLEARTPFVNVPTQVERLLNLSNYLGGPDLFVKRDDSIPAAFGGNKVRKLEFVVHAAEQAGADTLLTIGGAQSNHARATAAVAAMRGLRCHLVLNGNHNCSESGNLQLMKLFGAEIEFVARREDRMRGMDAAVARARREGRRPFAVPLGASTALGALGLVRAVFEMVSQVHPPDVIIHATSSGGTQAGLLAGCRLLGLSTRIIGISADEPADVIREKVLELVEEVRLLFGLILTNKPFDVEVDDAFVGEGYGLGTPESREAQALLATQEGLVLDPVYTAKAMAALIAYCRIGRFSTGERVMFWHTGGLPGLFA